MNEEEVDPYTDLKVTPCMCCDDDYEETPDTYCEICGNDCCESCLEGHICEDCIEQHSLEFQRNERWQKMTDSERANEISRVAL